MKDKQKHLEESADLHPGAEEKVDSNHASAGRTLSPQETADIIHNLQVHQIQLEMQNEELRRIQAELDASRDRYFDLYDMAPVGYCTLSEAGMVLEANLTISRMLGVTRTALIKQILTSYIHHEDQDIFYRHRKELFESGMPQNSELRMVKTDGSIFWAQISASPAQASDFTPLCHLIVSDISERKVLNDALLFLARQPWVNAGEDFFQALARFLAQVLDMDYVCIDSIEEDGLAAQTLVVYLDGHYEENISYALKDTPCENVTSSKLCCFPNHVRHTFPHAGLLQKLPAESYVGAPLFNPSGQAIGLIAAIGRKALRNPKLAEDILKIVALRASSELERRMAEERLQESEGRLVRAQAVSQVGSWEIDLRTHLMWASAEAFRIYGLDRSASPYIPLKFAQSIPLADERPRLDAALAGLLHENKKYDIEFRIQRSDDNATRMIHSMAELERDAAGTPIKVLGVFQDITERKQVEDAFLESHRRLNLALNVSKSGTWEWDLETDENFWSDELWSVYGLEPHSCEPSYNAWKNIIWEQDKQIVEQTVLEASRSAKEFSVEWRVQDPGGEIRWLMSRGHPIQDASGKLVRYIGIVMDITQRKHTDLALSQSEARFRGLVEDVNDVLFELDHAGQITYVSPVIESFTEYRADELIGRHITAIIDPRDIPLVMGRMQNVLSGTTLPTEYRVNSKTGRPLWVRSSSKPILEGGKAIGLRGVMVNITEMKKAEEALGAAHARLEALWSVSTLEDADLKKTSDHILITLARMTGSAYGFFGLVSEDESIMTIHAWSGEAMQDGAMVVKPQEYAICDAGVWAEVVRRKEALILNDFSGQHPAKKGLPEGLIQIERLLVVPFFSHGKILSVSAVANRPEEYTQDDVAQITAFMTSIHAVMDSKLAEEAMRRSEARYRQLFDDSPIPMLEQDFSQVKLRLDEIRTEGIPDFRAYFESHPEVVLEFLSLVRVSDENKASRKQRYRTESSEKMETLKQIIAPENVGSFVDELVHLANGGTEYRGEAVNLKANGEKIDVRVHWSVVPGFTDSLAKVIVTIEDISERKRAIKTLRESEARFKAVSEYSHNAICLIDEAGKIVWFNEAFVELGGYTREQIQAAENFMAFLAPESSEFVIGNFMKFVRKETYEHHYSFYIIRADGQKRLCEKHMTDYQDRNGKRILAISMVDVTERVQAEEALKLSKENFQQIVERSNDIFYRQNIHTARMDYVSPKCLDVLGYTPDEILAMDFQDQKNKIHPDDLPGLLQFAEELIDADTQGERHLEREFRLLTKQGEYRWIHGNYTLIRSKGDAPESVMGSLTDITARKSAEAEREKLHGQLLQAQKMESVGRLAGGVAHDFNNMLGVIIGHTEVALTKTSAEQAIYQDLQEILKAAGRSADLTRQLLAFARKQTASPRVIDLTETVSAMLKMLRRLIGENIELVWQPGPELWQTRIDPTQVDQVLANLLVNARDAITTSGKIIIETKNVVFDSGDYNASGGVASGEYVMLTVSDNGSGMDRDALSKLFEPFYTTKDLGQGTGLGLATVYGIVKQNGGYINVYSEPGQGTIFKIYLPRSTAEVTPAPPAETLHVPPSTSAELVLMVEDEEALLELGQEALERQGYTVLVAHTPEKALALAREHAGNIRLLITDVVMPGMNGRALAEEIRAIQPGLKCLFMSGYTADIISNQGVLPEGVSFIQKPFRLKELAQKVRQVIEEN